MFKSFVIFGFEHLLKYETNHQKISTKNEIVHFKTIYYEAVQGNSLEGEDILYTILPLLFTSRAAWNPMESSTACKVFSEQT